ncbi:FliG C-terminal domain-containing protein [Bdellovibrio sp. HCB209]|uniref:FliG C-terminal domain-containing protein n=1 Tax=Bdellovibrio sp. HCB209 TaxID=3394354 RepID=UPI0039B56E73
MGMLDRYKKKGGFYQLLQLLETSPTAKREQFLTLIAGENPVWEEALRKRILTIARVYSWDGQYLVEIFSRVQPMTLAYALHGNPQEQIDSLLSCLPPISKRKITDLMAEAAPTPAEKGTSISKMLTEVRGFVGQGIIRLEKVDPELHVPENIEEILNTTAFSMSTTPLTADSDVAKKDMKPNIVGDNDGTPSTAQSQEADFLRRKVNQLSSEVNALKHENTVLKDKLAQIKKIA